MLHGMHNQYVANVPSVPFDSQRLWDSGVTWLAIETSRGVYNWSKLDGWLQTGRNFIYCFGKTPGWAAANPTLPPTDMRMWDEYVKALVAHAGSRIAAYEIWNEPNLTKFYSGDITKLLEMAKRAFAIIKAAPSKPIVVSPCPTWSTTYKVPAGKTGTDCAVWMKDWLDIGGGQYSNAIAYHGYPDRKNIEGSTATKIKTMLETMSAHSVRQELWDTEASWGMEQDYPDPYLQAALLAKLYLLHSPKVARFYWYGWEYAPWGTLWDATNGEHAGAVAYREVYNWMQGKAIGDHIITSSGIYTVPVGTGLAVWNPTGDATFDVPEQFMKWRDLKGQQQSIPALRMTAPNRQIRIDTSPILLT